MKIEFDPLNTEEVKAVVQFLGSEPPTSRVIVEDLPPVPEPEPEPEKPKRTRRTKAQIEADKKVEATEYGYSEAKQQLTEIRDHPELGLGIVVQILKGVKVNKVDELQEKPDLLPKVKELCEAALG